MKTNKKKGRIKRLPDFMGKKLFCVTKKKFTGKDFDDIVKGKYDEKQRI